MTSDSIFLNGTVGVGKTTLADAISRMETRPHAIVDLDSIRRFEPPSSVDPFNHELELQNLRSIISNYRNAGAERFILAGVLEDPRELPRYLHAIGSCKMFICRIVAEPSIIESRLAARHKDNPEELRWHLARHGELTAILDANKVENFVVDSSNLSVDELAVRVRSAAQW